MRAESDDCAVIFCGSPPNQHRCSFLLVGFRSFHGKRIDRSDNACSRSNRSEGLPSSSGNISTTLPIRKPFNADKYASSMARFSAVSRKLGLFFLIFSSISSAPISTPKKTNIPVRSVSSDSRFTNVATSCPRIFGIMWPHFFFFLVRSDHGTGSFFVVMRAIIFLCSTSKVRHGGERSSPELSVPLGSPFFSWEI